MSTTADHETLGYHGGLDQGHDTAWGARAIRGRGHFDLRNKRHPPPIDLLGDRQDSRGTKKNLKRLSALLNKRCLPAARKIADDFDPTVHHEHTPYEDTEVVLLGNTNGSHGYLYLYGYLVQDESPDKEK